MTHFLGTRTLSKVAPAVCTVQRSGRFRLFEFVAEVFNVILGKPFAVGGESA
jgi:hypothetical protein